MSTAANDNTLLRRSFRGWLFIFLASVALKALLYMVAILPHAEAWSARLLSDVPPDYDDREYFQVARLLADTGKLLDPHAPASRPLLQAYRTPGYPAILSVLGRATGWSPTRMVLLQALILSFIPPLFASILRCLRHPTTPAWFLAVDPLSNLLSLSFMTEMWLVLCMLVALRLWVDPCQRLVFRGGALFVFFSAVLIKPSIQFFLVVIVLLTLLHRRQRWATALLALTACLPLLTWAYRNHRLTGRFCISTQVDACVMAPITIDALERGVPVRTVIGEWDERLGQRVMRVIMDNKLDFTKTTREYLRAHPAAFAKYHLLGMARLLLGTAREHCAQTLWLGAPSGSMAAYNGFMIAYYTLLYAAVLGAFSWRWLREPATQFAVLFIAYNLAVMGIYAYTTGGGLKRTPFLPFVYLLLAHGFSSLRRRIATFLRRPTQ